MTSPRRARRSNVVGPRQELGADQEPARSARSASIRSRSSATATSSSSLRRRKPRSADVRPAAGRRGVQQFVKRYGIQAAGPAPVEVFPNHDDFAVRTLGLARAGRRARRLLRPRGHDGLAARAPARRLQLAGHALARARARLLAAVVRVPRAALAHRGHLGLRGAPAAAGVGPRADARVRASAQQGRDLRREEAARRVQASRDACRSRTSRRRSSSNISCRSTASRRCARCCWLMPSGAKDADAFAKAFGRSVDDVDKSFEAFIEKRYAALRDAMADPPRQVDADDMAGLRARAPTAPGNFLSQLRSGGRSCEPATSQARATRSSGRRSSRPRRPATTARARCSPAIVEKSDPARARRWLRELLDLRPHEHGRGAATRGARAGREGHRRRGLRAAAHRRSSIRSTPPPTRSWAAGCSRRATSPRRSARVPGDARARPGQSRGGAHRCRRGAAQAWPPRGSASIGACARSRWRRRSRGRRICCSRHRET